MSGTEIFITIIRVGFGVFVPLSAVAVMVWMERRGAGFIQDRAGPNRCNVLGFRFGGLLQNIADAIKLLFKEDVIPGHIAHKFYFILAPALVFITALLCFAVIPFADALVLGASTYLMQAMPLELGILWFLAIIGFGVYGIILAGWASHNKYGLLGGLRAAAQVISYEIPMGLALVSLLAVYGTVNLTEVTQFQGRLLFGVIPMWGVVLQPLGFIIFVIAAFAETNRTPFDLAEGESEIVAGFHVEYSSMKFALFFMGEYIAMFVSSALIVTLFFGGYQIPWLNTQTLVAHARPVAVALMLILPAAAYVFARWIGFNNPGPAPNPAQRVRETKVYIAVVWSLVALIEVILLGYIVAGAGGAADRILVVWLQTAVFLLKTFFVCFVYVWVRWTLPRFRYDQLQKLGWEKLLPLALFNIFITGAVVVALG
ncbi:MAG: NADH-quinone oxidoreductase subunit H [Desulfofustis sp. PB-SRB1]|nr:NADH-quinone oxidoreductase subunit H [Desulfofustis sp. PB-SRB1]MBM1003903.1 NADH-quinone oxidoreductase subunit H [Desulfofustis sp. PB-SRB1]HBH27911.1 NADH-quinone oxidoreductase subunit H [Desulfofustis sp.]HBH31253.1 NADH-quinone oxidoreductase subunit H [Desulfofustis sp.]